METQKNQGITVKPRIFKKRERVVSGLPFNRNQVNPSLGSFEGEQVCLIRDEVISLTKYSKY